MADVMLYQYAIILQEKRNKHDDIVEEAKLLVEPTTIMAREEHQAQMLAARSIPEEYAYGEAFDRITVAMRPF